MRTVSVAVPVRNGGALFAATLAAIGRQQVDAEVEVVVLDSGSSDGSVAVAVAAGARVESIDPATFGHGRARNRLMELTEGAVVAFLTQDATPAGNDWLARLLDGLDAAPDVALVSGPYAPRPDAPAWIRREFEAWFASMSDGVSPGVVREPDLDRRPDGSISPSPASFHTDANGAVLRSAWHAVPFRDVSYAEDQLLALDMLAAGYAKAFQPLAPVVHSHSYGPAEELRRSFDEGRAMHEVYGHVAAAAPRAVVGRARVEARRDRAYARRTGERGAASARFALRAFGYHLARGVGAALGARAEALPGAVRSVLSLERRSTFVPTAAN